MALTLRSYRARHLRLARKKREFERRRDKLLRAVEELDGRIAKAAAEIAALDAVVTSIEAYDRHSVAAAPPVRRARPGQHSAEVNEAIIAALVAAAGKGMTKQQLYDHLDAARLPLPSRASFAPHLSYFGRDGGIVSRAGRWYAAGHAPAETPAAIAEAVKAIRAAPNGLTREEIAEALAGVPHNWKSLSSQLGAALKEGRLARSGERFTVVGHDAE